MQLKLRRDLKMQIDERREFYCEFDLSVARKAAMKEAAAHQAMAIDHLINWYNAKRDAYAGGILVLPTGGGKTFTAIRFLCLTALSDG
jgi:ATP-dependent helicase IRC3